jgi:gluconolactonase
MRFSVAVALLLLAPSLIAAQASTPTAVDPAAHYPEGPVWHDGALYYVEYSAGNIKRWDAAGAKPFWHRNGCGPSGLADFHGHWLVACYDDNSLAEIDTAGKLLRELRQDSQGKPFVGPNDFAADGRGGIYFSASGVYDVKAPITGAVLHLAADGARITRLAETIHYPNGLTLTRDGGQLLVAEMLAGRILSFPVGADGTLGARTVWARLADLAPPTPHTDAYNGPDGLKLGRDGNYYIAQNGSGRVLVVSEEKKLVRAISVPTPYVTNLAFGDAGTVFVVGVFDEWKAPFPGAVYRWRP